MKREPEESVPDMKREPEELVPDMKREPEELVPDIKREPEELVPDTKRTICCFPHSVSGSECAIRNAREVGETSGWIPRADLCCLRPEATLFDRVLSVPD
ncbi:hypothetical protein JZ751_011713 [Albula glossodonta]|uniref:Uncharacterized protein n=1 Tax=Albula glossodonta TaxID=121402 RepID=A0A8T2PQG5_9TELE|nr:hypothetical protein JZ751_011713 [Albula glossodonta]